jgi:predicted metal-dependent hydrolase
MQKKIILNNQEIKYNLKKSQRAKRLRLAICCDASITVTQPFFLNEKEIEKFLHQKASWLLDKISSFNKSKIKILPKDSYNEFVSKKKDAYLLIKERIEYFNKIYNFKFNKISVKRQISRWGSCSRRGNINFNYKILFLPQALADYIIVHELCHLKEFNHSRKFWDLVSLALPNYLNIRRELRKII